MDGFDYGSRPQATQRASHFHCGENTRRIIFACRSGIGIRARSEIIDLSPLMEYPSSGSRNRSGEPPPSPTSYKQIRPFVDSLVRAIDVRSVSYDNRVSLHDNYFNALSWHCAMIARAFGILITCQVFYRLFEQLVLAWKKVIFMSLLAWFSILGNKPLSYKFPDL